VAVELAAAFAAVFVDQRHRQRLCRATDRTEHVGAQNTTCEAQARNHAVPCLVVRRAGAIGRFELKQQS
jgi:hypothetical protein